jgi:hypothetical protein
LFISKLKEPKATDKINMEDAKSIIGNIAEMLKKESTKVNEEYEKIQKLQMTTSKLTAFDHFQSEDGDGEFAFLQ